MNANTSFCERENASNDEGCHVQGIDAACNGSLSGLVCRDGSMVAHCTQGAPSSKSPRSMLRVALNFSGSSCAMNGKLMKSAPGALVGRCSTRAPHPQPPAKCCVALLRYWQSLHPDLTCAIQLSSRLVDAFGIQSMVLNDRMLDEFVSMRPRLFASIFRNCKVVRRTRHHVSSSACGGVGWGGVGWGGVGWGGVGWGM